jgi:CRP/FNR family transcriptional regulator
VECSSGDPTETDGAAAASGDRWRQPTHTYPRGVELFHQGDRLREVCQLESGTVKLTQLDGNGGESIVGLVLPGEWLGTAAVIVNRPTPVSAVTCGRVVVNAWSADAFRRLLQEDPQLSLQIHTAQALQLQRLTSRVGQLCSLTSRERLQAVLCRFASMFRSASSGSSVRLQLPLHQWEVAAFIGVTPEHLSRLLKEMEQDGAIRRDKGWIILPRAADLCDSPWDDASWSRLGIENRPPRTAARDTDLN